MQTEYDFLQLARFIRSHILALLIIIFTVVAGFYLGAKIFLPVKYKAFSVITIPSRYFQQPAVEDILPAVQDPGEMRVLREGLVTGAVDKEFLEKLRIEYDLFPEKAEDELQYEKNMQKLSSQFEIISLSVTSFQVGFLGNKSDITFAISKKLQERVVERLVEERKRKLLDLRDNLLEKIDSLGFSVNQAGDPLSTSRPEVLRGELQTIRGIIASLKSRYTSEHPLVQRYKQREALIIKWLADHKIPVNGKIESRANVQGLSSSNLSDVERYTDLLKRVDRINIMVDFEGKNIKNLIEISAEPVVPLAPVSPNMRLVFLWGLIAAMLVSAVYISIKSYSNLVNSPALEIAAQLKINYLGKIPDLTRDFTIKEEPSLPGEIDPIKE